VDYPAPLLTGRADHWPFVFAGCQPQIRGGFDNHQNKKAPPRRGPLYRNMAEELPKAYQNL
jgi:hypothetical protein